MANPFKACIITLISAFLLLFPHILSPQKSYSQDIETVPLFQLFQPEPSYLATLCIGSGTSPGIGYWERFQLWLAAMTPDSTYGLSPLPYHPEKKRPCLQHVG